MHTTQDTTEHGLAAGATGTGRALRQARRGSQRGSRVLADVSRLASALNLVSRLASTQPASCSAARRSLSARRRPHATAVPSAVPELPSGFARATVAACFNQPSKCGAPSGRGGMRGAKADGGGGGGGAYSYMGEKACARTDRSEAWACTLSMLFGGEKS